MSQNKWCVVSFLVAFFLSSTALSNPASTEYVKSAIETLRAELNAQYSARFNHLTSKINELTLELNAFKNQASEQESNTNNKIETVKQQINELPIVTHHIGEIFQGGMIFYVDATQQHGLMVSLTDVGTPIEWRNGEGGDRIVNAKAYGLGAGDMNTRLIIAQQTADQQEGEFAALRATNYQTSPSNTLMSFSGWYLPSRDELILIYKNLKAQGLGQFAEAPYWSSSEENTTQAWLVDLSNGEPQLADKSSMAQVRAIHPF